jgi:hypothetical protein
VWHAWACPCHCQLRWWVSWYVPLVQQPANMMAAGRASRGGVEVAMWCSASWTKARSAAAAAAAARVNSRECAKSVEKVSWTAPGGVLAPRARAQRDSRVRAWCHSSALCGLRCIAESSSAVGTSRILFLDVPLLAGETNWCRCRCPCYLLAKRDPTFASTEASFISRHANCPEFWPLAAGKFMRAEASASQQFLK